MHCQLCGSKLSTRDLKYGVCKNCITTEVDSVTAAISAHTSKEWIRFYSKEKQGA